MGRMNQVTIGLFCAGLSTLSWGASPVCGGGSNLNYFNQGYSIQRNLVHHLWVQNLKLDCTQLDSFIGAVDLPFGFDQPRSPGLRCRSEGMVEGLMGAINEITDGCTTECTTNGSATGNLLGAQLCNTTQYRAIMELNICNFVAEQSCRSALVGYVNSHCPSKADEARNLSDVVCKMES